MDNRESDSYAQRTIRYKDNYETGEYGEEIFEDERYRTGEGAAEPTLTRQARVAEEAARQYFESVRSKNIHTPLRTAEGEAFHAGTAAMPEVSLGELSPEPEESKEFTIDPSRGIGERIEGIEELPRHKKSKVRHRRNSSAHRVKTKRRKREIVGWVVSVLLAIMAALLIRAFVFEIILVDGQSMFPTLHTNERVAIEKVSRYSGLPDRGDIIIVEYPNLTGTYVKRTIGLPGETVEVRDSVVYINGVALKEDYINTEPFDDMEQVIVPEGHVFVMGDNRARSLDSRTSYIGPISKDAIVGHAMFVIWPLDNIHTIASVEYP